MFCDCCRKPRAQQLPCRGICAGDMPQVRVSLVFPGQRGPHLNTTTGVQPQGRGSHGAGNDPPPPPPPTPPGALLQGRRRALPPPERVCSTCVRDVYTTEGKVQEDRQELVLPSGAEPSSTSTACRRKPKDTKIHIFLPSTSLNLSVSSLDSFTEGFVTTRGEWEDNEQVRPARSKVTKVSRYKVSGRTPAPSSSSSPEGPVGNQMKAFDTPDTAQNGFMTDSPTQNGLMADSDTTPTMLTHASPGDLALLRDLSLRVGPRWREVAAGLGLQGPEMEALVRANPMSKGSELAYRTLAVWWRTNRQPDAKVALQKVFKEKKLLAAEAVLMNRHLASRQEPPLTSAGTSGMTSAGTSGMTSAHVRPGTTNPDTQKDRQGQRGSMQRHLTTSGRPKTSVVRAKTAGGGRRLVLSNTVAAQEGAQVGGVQVGVGRTVEEDPVHLCVTNTVLQRPKTSMATPSKAKDGEDSGGQEVADLAVHLAVGGLVAEDPRRALLRFYTTVLRDEDCHIEALTSHPALAGVTVQRFTLDSFVMFVRCRNQQTVTNLETLHRSRKLGEVVTSVLATPAMLGEVGVQALSVEANLHRAEVERYRKSLRSGDYRRGAKRAETAADGGEAWSGLGKTARLMLDLNRKLSAELTSLRGRYHLLEGQMDDLLMALKMSRSTNMDANNNNDSNTQKITCLNDVMAAFGFLRSSPSIGKNVRTDLVREYLSIVNLTRITCDEIQRDLSVDDLSTSRDPVVVGLLSEVETLLEPSFDFSNMAYGLSINLTPMERKYFRGLLSFIPCVLDKLSGICDYVRTSWEQPVVQEESHKHNKAEGKPCKVRFPSIHLIK